MKVLTASEMRRIDRIAIEEFGIPGEVLMAHAGRAVFRHIIDNYSSAAPVAVVAGAGNNGGDGFVAAYLLHNAKIQTEVFCIGSADRISPSSSIYRNLCVKSGLTVTLLENGTGMADFSRFGLVVDALFGTGFTGPARGVAAEVITAINVSGAKVLAIDLPSGLGSDGEAPSGPVIRADSTITIGLPKISLVTYPGMEYAGILSVADIGFPRQLTESEELAADLVDADFFEKAMRVREKRDVHKSRRGHLLLVGGFPGMEGAAIMSGQGALAAGVGYLSLLTDERSRPIIAGKIPEMMTRGVDMELMKRDPDAFFNDLDSYMSGRRYDAMVLGPGLGREEGAAALFRRFVLSAEAYGIGRILIDGDGLYHLAGLPEPTKPPQGSHFILTPHLMEASRIMKVPVDEIKSDRCSHARLMAEKTGSVVLLKGPGTIITDGTRTLINSSGNPALATAGTGDILSGIIGAFLLIGELSPLYAAGAGAYIHGRAADRYIASTSRPRMKATDILRYL